MKRILLLTLAALSLTGMLAQATGETRVVIYEREQPVEMPAGSTRSLFGNVWLNMRQSYKATVAGQISTLSSDIVSSGIGALVEALRSKRTDWQKQLQQDLRYTRTIRMDQELKDFYANVSEQGALDPDGMQFEGFGIQKFVKIHGADGRDSTLLAFEMKCTMRTDEEGMARMLHHGKFEVVLDHLYLNPYLCDLPNDSLTSAQQNALRTPFDFEKRKDLRFSVVADFTSSYMTEAIQLMQDQPLGSFTVEVLIPNEAALEQDGPYAGYFVYDRNQQSADVLQKKQVRVSGECFLVPRSFIGTQDGAAYKRVFGTGQYRVNLTLSESCAVNWPYYYTEERPGHQRWNRHWTEEWNKMKRRRRAGKTFWGGIWDDVKVNYANYRWVYTLTEPVANGVLTYENKYVAKHLNKWLDLGSSTASGTALSAAAAQSASGASQGAATAGKGAASQSQGAASQGQGAATAGQSSAGQGQTAPAQMPQ